MAGVRDRRNLDADEPQLLHAALRFRVVVRGEEMRVNGRHAEELLSRRGFLAIRRDAVVDLYRLRNVRPRNKRLDDLLCNSGC